MSGEDDKDAALEDMREAVAKLVAARLAADVMGTPTLVIARTDAEAADLVTSDVDANDKGFLTGDSVTCALHLSRFDLFSGEALDPPAVLPLMRWPVSVEEGSVVLELPEGPLVVNE